MERCDGKEWCVSCLFVGGEGVSRGGQARLTLYTSFCPGRWPPPYTSCLKSRRSVNVAAEKKT